MDTSENLLTQLDAGGAWSVLGFIAVVLLFLAFLRWYRTKPQLSVGEATVWFFVIFLVPVLGAGAFLYRARTLHDPRK